MSLRLWITVLWVGTIAVIVGCSGKAPPATTPEAAATTAAATPGAAPATGTPAATAPTAGTAAAPTTVDPAHPETKWIGTIPYDVFYDQPLTIASDSTPVNGGASGGGAPPGDAAMATTAKPKEGEATPAAVPAATGGKADWGKVIPLEVALEAVKVARTEVNASLQGVQKYNKGRDTIRMNAALIGMMAMVVAEHPEAANWKTKAKYVRDLSYDIQSKATEQGSGPFKATQELFEQITGMLDGGQPPEKESKDVVPYVEVADRADMMKIIDKTMNDLKANIGDPKRMKDQSSEVTRQLSVLHAMGVLMTDASYDAADNPEYQGYNKEFIEGAAAGVEAVKSDSFDGFQGALNKLNKSCGDCHPKFRGGEGG